MPSNARYKNVGYRTFNFVPCQHCFQCRTQKATSYYVRAFNELKLFNDANCMVLFILLTYKEEFLPRVSNDVLDCVSDNDNSQPFVYRLNWNSVYNGFWYDKIDYSFDNSKKHRISKNSPWEDQSGTLCNVDFKPLPTFSIGDIDKFFKKIRSRFKKHLKYVPNISYFLVAENGDKKQRPHYHIMLFIDLPKSFYYLVKSIVIDSWSVRLNIPHFVPYLNKYGSYRKVKKNGEPYGFMAKTTTFQRGLVFFDEENGKQFVNPNDPKVSRYLSQYLTTDPYFETLHHDNLKQLSPKNQRIYTKKFGSFRLCSQFFGISALWDGSINIDTAKINVGDCSGHQIDLPFYYYRYIYYSKDDTGRFVRNANYTNLLINRINERYERLKISFARFYSHIRCGLIHPNIYKVYENYVSFGLSRYTSFYKGCKTDCRHYYKDIEKELPFLIERISYTQLLGYYLILFCVHKQFNQNENDFNSLSYMGTEYLDYTFNHLDDKEFITSCLAEFYKLQQKAPFIGDSDCTNTFDLRCVDSESLCILFSVWLKFDLVTTNNNKFEDWNKKARSLGKAKYLARPHALIEV